MKKIHREGSRNEITNNALLYTESKKESCKLKYSVNCYLKIG